MVSNSISLEQTPYQGRQNILAEFRSSKGYHIYLSSQPCCPVQDGHLLRLPSNPALPVFFL